MGNLMLKLFNNRDLAKEFGVKGKEIVSNKFSLNAHLSVVEKLINSIEN